LRHEERRNSGKKKQAVETACEKEEGGRLDIGLGLAEALHAIAGLPLAALAEEVDAFEALQDVAFDDQAGDALETFVL
jgi:hypothetical protein